jgi:hypothetical protein
VGHTTKLDASIGGKPSRVFAPVLKSHEIVCTRVSPMNPPSLAAVLRFGRFELQPFEQRLLVAGFRVARREPPSWPDMPTALTQRAATAGTPTRPQQWTVRALSPRPARVGRRANAFTPRARRCATTRSPRWTSRRSRSRAQGSLRQMNRPSGLT